MLKALSGKVDEAIRAAPSVFFLDEIDSFTHRNRPGRRSDYSRADFPLYTIDTALNKIAVLLARYAEETIVLGGASNGSGLEVNSDLSRAPVLAARTVFEWGLDDRLTHIAYETEFHLKPGDDNDKKVDDILQKQLSRATEIIESHRPLLKRIANALITHRELGREDIRALLDTNTDHQANGPSTKLVRPYA